MRQPKKKPQKQNEKLQRPEHHLFTNFRLNEMFCESPEEAAAWAKNAIKAFEDNVTDLPEEVKADFLSYVAAVTEVSFEWGFKTAIDEVITLVEESHNPSPSQPK